MRLRIALAITTGLALSACSHQPADTAFQHIDSGIDAQNGGGQNSTNGLVNGDLVTTRVGPSGPPGTRIIGSPTSGVGGPSADPAVLAGQRLPDQPEAR